MTPGSSLTSRRTVSLPNFGDGSLGLGPGPIPVSTAWLPAPLVCPDDGELLIQRIDVTDDRGVTFRAYVPRWSIALLDMLRFGDPASVNAPGRVLLAGVSCHSDRRQWLSGLHHDGETFAAYALSERYLRVTVDVLGPATPDGTGARVRSWPLEYGVMGSNQLGPVAASGAVFGRMALAICGPLYDSIKPIFHRLDALDLDACGWSGLTRLMLQDYFRQPWIEYGPGSRLTRIWRELPPDDGDRFFLDVEPLRGDRPDYDLTAALQVVRTPAALARLDALSQDAHEPLARAAHSALVNLGRPRRDDILHMAARWRETGDDEALYWLYWVALWNAPEPLISGTTREGLIEALAVLLGPAAERREWSVVYRGRGDLQVELSLRANQAHVWVTHRANIVWPSRNIPLPWSDALSFDGTWLLPVALRLPDSQGEVVTLGPGPIAFRVGMKDDADEAFVIEPDTTSVQLTLAVFDAGGRTCSFTRPLTSTLIARWARLQTPDVHRHEGAYLAFWQRAELARPRGTIAWGDVRFSGAIEHIDPSQGSRPCLIELAQTRTAAWLYWTRGLGTRGPELAVGFETPQPGEWRVGRLRLTRLAEMILCPSCV